MACAPERVLQAGLTASGAVMKEHIDGLTNIVGSETQSPMIRHDARVPGHWKGEQRAGISRLLREQSMVNRLFQENVERRR